MPRRNYTSRSEMPPRTPKPELVSRCFALCLIVGSFAFATWPSRAWAAPVAVDTELILLVDVSGSVTDADFALLTAAYGMAMTNSAVLDAIQNGQVGKIATSLLFWSSHDRQSIGVDWMEISDLSSAQAFSNQITSTTRPFGGQTAIAAALDVATPMFGTETGGAENGFQSVTQIIDVAGDGVDNSSRPRRLDRSVTVAASRDAALAAGVDLISGIAIGDISGDLEDYYANYVIGGAIADTEAFTNTADAFSSLQSALVSNLVNGINASAIRSTQNAVPEPKTLLFLPFSILLLFRRQRAKN